MENTDYITVRSSTWDSSQRGIILYKIDAQVKRWHTQYIIHHSVHERHRTIKMYMKFVLLVIFVSVAKGQDDCSKCLQGGYATKKVPSRPSHRTQNTGKAHQQIIPNAGITIQPGKITSHGRLIITHGRHPDIGTPNLREEEQILLREWNLFKVQYNKSYPSPEDENFRREIFIENRKKIVQFNQDYSFGLARFVLKINPYADLLTHEYNDVLNGFGRIPKKGANGNSNVQGTTYIPSFNVVLPETMDWKALGAVSKVKNQGKCGGCFAFSAAGAVEGHNFRKTGYLEELSPQNLIDCAREEYSNQGCSGGYVDESFKYIKANPGIDTLGSYPYEADDGPCRFDRSYIGANVTGYVSLPEGDESALATAVATQGPVSIAIDASQSTFQFYSDGVYHDENCKSAPENLNHAVLVVGYGVEADGTKYWLVKNTYGPDWGIGGYIKIAKDMNNHCGIASSAFYPLV